MENKEVTPVEEATEQPQHTPFDLFALKFRDRIAMWLDHHPEQTSKFKHLPIISLGGGNYHWQNRTERRRKR